MTKKLMLGFFLVFSTSSISYALPFTIVTKAGTQLPTVLHSQSTATAFYTVKNNTSSQRDHNFVKYLPPNTTQVTTGGAFADTCGTTFSLAPGGSCTLQLTISGAINAQDPDPHHHLFVCFPGGTTCSGTNNPLNVTLNSDPEFAYVTNLNTGIISFCPRNGDGSFGTCTIATSGFVTPGQGTVNPAGNLLYFVDGNAGGVGSVYYCPMASNGTLGTCAVAATGFSGGFDIVFNAAGTIAYISNNVGDSISFCTVNADGTFSNCATTGGSVEGPIGINFNPAHTLLYIAASDDNRIEACEINNNGSLGTCSVVGTGFSLPSSIVFNTTGTIAYITNALTTNSVSQCNVGSTGLLTGCVSTGNGFSNPVDIAFNENHTIAYVVNNGNDTVSYCTVTPGTEALTNCDTTGNGFNGPAGIILP